MGQSWMNADGLLVKFNGSAGTATAGGEYASEGDRSIIELDLDLTTLTTTSNGTQIPFDNLVLPKSAWIEEVEIIATVAATSAGSGATLNMGLTRMDRTTQIGTVAVLNAIVQANHDATNETNHYTTIGAGSLGTSCGAATTNPAYLSIWAGVEVYTAGFVHIKIYFRMNANTLGGANA